MSCSVTNGNRHFVLATCENPHLVLVTTPYAGGSHLLSLTWEQALRHRLPEVLRRVAHVASETMFALNEYRACVPELQRLLQESQLECRHPLVCRLKKAKESRNSLLAELVVADFVSGRSIPVGFDLGSSIKPMLRKSHRT